MLAGIDYSLTCPGIFVGSRAGFQNGKAFFFRKPKSKKNTMEGVYGDNVFAMDQPIKYNSEIERFSEISDWAIGVVKQMGVDTVVLEGYAMAARGRVFNIAENTAILKYKLWNMGVDVHIVSPSTNKKAFSGKGNAKKEDMYEAFQHETGVDLAELLGVKSKDSPVSDIVDAYSLFRYGLDEFYL